MDNVILRDRQRRILRFLNGNQIYMTGQALAERLNVSARTVRSDIVEINRCIDPTVAVITAYRGKGYRLEIADRDRFHNYISRNVALLTREDRTQYLLLRLLWSEAPLRLDLLEDEMYISRTTLENDIRALQSSWITDRLQFLRHRDTLFLVQEEPEIRIAFLRLYSENIDFNSRSGIISAGGTLNLEQLSVLRSDLRHLLVRHKILLDDFSFIYFALAAWVSSFRTGRLPQICPDVAPPLQAVMQDVAQLFSGKYEIPLPLSELFWLQDTLAKLQRQPSQAMEAVMHQAIGAAAKEFPAPFLDSERFFNAFRNFICDCTNRMAFPRFDSQDLLLELESANPDLAQLSRFLTQQALQLLDLPNTAVDPLTLLPSLIAAKNRFITRHPEIQPVALVVCHLPDSLSVYLCERLSQHFAGRLRLQGPFPVYDRGALEYTDCDFLISTVDMTGFRSLAVPAVTISPHLTPADFGAINQMAYETMLQKHFS